MTPDFKFCVACGESVAYDGGRCTNRCCASCHARHCTPGGATAPGHGLKVKARFDPATGNLLPQAPAEFWDSCSNFDFFYEMSDDGRVWRAGERAKARLLHLAPEGSENRRIWDAWTRHHFSGKPWGTVKEPRPERPA